ncbi:hypothetical protein Vadar_015928 [Vaccinium darrowii]|uniref:Uncharacterized protein n=1 Tax=Vaccinium darrowii TaxID=229202 RepID=A0ACB7XQZ9_9ERIC|nr:hypothetical protein Vadar_015928 [Vaccinium darrowii]
METTTEALQFDEELFHNLERKLKQNYADEELFCIDKARVDWLKGGDRNTAYFRAKSSNLQDFEEVLSCVNPVVTTTMNRLISMGKVRDAIFQMPPSKAPGHDGKPAEGLSRMLVEAEARKKICEIKLSRGGPSVSHLFFADDTLLFSKACTKDVEVNVGILDKYGKASGQEANFGKEGKSLVSRMLKAKYYPGSSFLDAKCGPNSSWAWLIIVEGRNGGRWKLRSEKAIFNYGLLLSLLDGKAVQIGIAWSQSGVQLSGEFGNEGMIYASRQGSATYGGCQYCHYRSDRIFGDPKE